MKRRLLAWFLVCTMVLSLVPMDVRAEETGMTWSAWTDEESVLVPEGENATLEVVVENPDDVELTYTWYRLTDQEGNVEVVAEGSTTCVAESVTTYSQYYCNIVDSNGQVDTVWFDVSVDTGLTVLTVESEYTNTEESDAWVTVPYGEMATLEVEASVNEGEEEPTYQWYVLEEEQEAIPDATDSSYEIGPVNGEERYYCRVTDGYGYSVEASFYVSADTGLTIEAIGDTDIKVDAGGTVQLEVEASGTGDITYQWYKVNGDGEDEVLSGENSESFTTPEIFGYSVYYCSATDSYGVEDSVYFYIYINTDWTAGQENDESDIIVEEGSSATLNVVVESESDHVFTYQWYKWTEEDGEEELDGNTASYTTEAISGYTGYYCMVTDEDGNEDYVWFYVYIDAGWTAEAKNDYVEIDAGTSATLEVAVESEEDHDFTYQWYKWNPEEEDEWMEEEAAATFVTPELDGYTEYYCIVTDEKGNDKDVWFSIYVNPEWTAMAADGQDEINIGVNETATLEVEIASEEDHDFTYQWYKWNDDGEYEWIEDEESSSYTTGAITEFTRYVCEVTDEYENMRTVFFSIYVGPQWNVTTENDGTQLVEVNDTATLEVGIESDEEVSLAYQWYQIMDGYEAYLIEDATQSSYTTDAISTRTVYYCIVSDEYGKVMTVWFNVLIAVNWNAEAVGETEISVARYDITTLEVEVNNEEGIPLTYQWWKYNAATETSEPIENATDMSYTTEGITEDTTYYCIVSDVYDNEYYIDFILMVDEEKQHTHTYGAYGVKEKATCSKAGTEVSICKGCKEEDAKTIPATGKHTYGTYKQTKAATCTVAGTKTRTCSVCAKVETEAIPATGKHTYGEWKVTKEPTCTAKGSQERICSVCNNKETSEIAATGYVKGATFTKSKYIYKITAKSGKKGSVTLVGTTKKQKKISVPKTVKVGGITFKVTAIADKAFKGNTKLTSVTIGANVTKIGKESFSGCKKLKKITIKSTGLKSVGKNAIKGIDKKTTIKVPKSKLKKYKNLFKTKTGYKKTMKIQK